MKIGITTASLAVALCFIGCSKDGASTGEAASSTKARRLVPATAAEVMASPDYKLEHTTKSGLKLYVRPLTPEIAKSIPEDSPDQEFLQGDETSPYYFLVLVKNDKIIDSERASEGELTPADTGEVMGFIMKRDPGMQKLLKEAAKSP
jgi:hypothetical protein